MTRSSIRTRRDRALFFSSLLLFPLPSPPAPARAFLGPAGPTRHYQPFREIALFLPSSAFPRIRAGRRHDRALISQFALIGGRGHFSARRARFPGRGNECVIIELALRIFKTAPRFPGPSLPPSLPLSSPGDSASRRFFILPSFCFFSSPCSLAVFFLSSPPLFPSSLPERTVARGLSPREAA